MGARNPILSSLPILLFEVSARNRVVSPLQRIVVLGIRTYIVEKYAIKFQTPDLELVWNNKTLREVIYEGQSGHTKDELAGCDLHVDLHDGYPLYILVITVSIAGKYLKKSNRLISILLWL